MSIEPPKLLFAGIETRLMPPPWNIFRKVISTGMPISTFSCNESLLYLFQKLLLKREHICCIAGDRGKFLGILTLEDLMEQKLGLEIYDEQDHLIPP